ncbi:MAG: hypothetical protein LOY58_12320 [Gammaproteobacteria bacterium]|nr:hypothetical protein [Gammaproteobacteria bacterium]
MGVERLRGMGWAVALLAGLQLPAAMAETADERLQRLENEIEELRQMLREQRKAAPPAPAPAAPAAAPAPASVPYAEAVPVQNGAYIRYYIRNERLGERPPADGAAVEGRISNTEELSFDPSAYDVPNAGLFSNYRDPASYRYVGVVMEGELPVRTAGDYEFVLSPKPAREGGANVATRMSVWLQVDDRPVLEFRDQASWRIQRGQVRLSPGPHRVRLWAVAASDGFGPSPTASRLLVAVKGPGDASPRPLRDLRVAE